ncbi:hypothetical protein BLNAU_2330 [Blattamonas nauphoetae]|uniref:Uncharacterized protein n=1 Tax=Blattamonas nauphoetae TaxID=2049346 RepID=A0ABQ9YFL7_9EUKA|nr:hypothetical protein BLNAU_2330 [Blattamonas nauphoetae]
MEKQNETKEGYENQIRNRLKPIQAQYGYRPEGDSFNIDDADDVEEKAERSKHKLNQQLMQLREKQAKREKGSRWKNWRETEQHSLDRKSNKTRTSENSCSKDIGFSYSTAQSSTGVVKLHVEINEIIAITSSTILCGRSVIAGHHSSTPTVITMRVPLFDRIPHSLRVSLLRFFWDLL